MSHAPGLRWAPLAIAMCGTVGGALAAILGLWEPGWGVAAAFVMLVAALSAGVLRDPDGPEVHVFLAAALAFTAGFLAVSIAITEHELAHFADNARDDARALVAEESARIRAEVRPKWLVIGGALGLGALALARRRRVLARRRT